MNVINVINVGDQIKFHFLYEPSETIFKKYKKVEDKRILAKEKKFMENNLDHIGQSFVDTLTDIMYEGKIVLKHVNTGEESLTYELIEKDDIDFSIENLYDQIWEMEKNIAADSYLEGRGADFVYNDSGTEYASTFHFNYFEVF